MLTICAEQIGLTGEDFFTPLTADLLAVDTYFAGRVTDQILGMEFSPLGERFFPLIDGSPGAGSVPATGSAELTALDFGVSGTNPSETGMLLFTDGTFARRRRRVPEDRIATGQRGAGRPGQLGSPVRRHPRAHVRG